MAKFMLWVCIGIAGAVGGGIAYLINRSSMSLSVLLSTVGSIGGIWVWYRYFRYS